MSRDSMVENTSAKDVAELGDGTALQALIDALSKDETNESEGVWDSGAALESWRNDLEIKREHRRLEAELNALEMQSSASEHSSDLTPEPEPEPTPQALPAPPHLAFDEENGLDFNAFLDRVCADFETASASHAARMGALETQLDGRSVPLDAARTRLVEAAAHEAGCPPETILATAIDLYFSVLERA